MLFQQMRQRSLLLKSMLKRMNTERSLREMTLMTNGIKQRTKERKPETVDEKPKTKVIGMSGIGRRTKEKLLEIKVNNES